MTLEEQRKIQQTALNTHGIIKQQWMLIEECGELLNAIAKSKRNRAGKDEIITELADVSIIVEQMAFFYGEEDFNKEKERKLLRLKERLQKHTMDKNQGEQQPKWTDEDEELLQHCCGAVAAADYYTLEDKEEMQIWLNSLKQRIEQ